MPGTKKPNRKPKKKRPPQVQATHGAGAGGPAAEGGKKGSGPGDRQSIDSPARVSRGAARGG